MRQKIIAASLAASISIAAPVIMHFEGKKNRAYLDPVSIPTICYGHTLTAKIGQVKTDAECEQLLKNDMKTAVDAVDKLVSVEIGAERRAALISFVYNVGVGAFGKSTLLKKLNSGDSAGACKELDRWVNAGGKVLPGLVTRRKEERRLCEIGL